MEIEAPAVAPGVHSGHHVELRAVPGGESLTLPIARYDREKQTITVVVDDRYPGAAALAGLDEGGGVFQISEARGAACKFDSLNKVVLAAEDLGVASLYCRARKYKEMGTYTILVLGFENKDAVFWEEEFSGVSDELYVCTRDGSYGVKGVITNPVRAVCETHKNVERIIIIGQLDKMKKVAKIASDFDVTALMSFDAVRQPAGRPSIFETAGANDTASPQETFAFARSPEIDANDIDFDKLLAKQRAIIKETDKPPAAT